VIVVQKTDSIYQIILGSVWALFIYLVGGIDKLFIACTILIVLDYVTGFLSAWYRKELISRTAWFGLLRKGLMLVPMIVANQVDLISGIENSHYARNAMMFFIIATEGTSIFEHLGKLGLKYPKFIIESLTKLRGDTGQRRRKTDR
jgi:toxin secretion/phage lysis holin